MGEGTNISPLNASVSAATSADYKHEITEDRTEIINKKYDDKKHLANIEKGKRNQIIQKAFNDKFFKVLVKIGFIEPEKLEQWINESNQKAQLIPEENLVEPRINIIGPTFEGLKYNLDEEHIKEMFTQILLSEINSNSQNKVHPSYIETVKQLSKEDAEFLVEISGAFTRHTIFICDLYRRDQGNNHFTSYICIYTSESKDFYFKEIDGTTVDNIQRLGLYDYTKIDESKVHMYNIFSDMKNFFELTLEIPIQNLSFKYGYLSLNNYGDNFLDICINNKE